MRMGRRLLVALLLATLAGVASIVLFVGSERGGAHLCALAEATLRDASGEDVRIGRCRVDPARARVEIDDVVIGDSAAPLVAAERISAGLEVRGLLEGRVRVEGAQLVRPRISLDLTKKEEVSETTPRRRRAGACLPSLGSVEIGTLDIVGGALDVALPEGRSVRTEGLGLSVRGNAALLELGVRAERTTVTLDGPPVVVERTELQGHVDLESGRAKLERLDLSAAEGSLFADAEFTNVCAPRGLVNATVHGELGVLGASLLRMVPGLAGSADAQIRVKVDGDEWNADVRLQARETAALGMALGGFELAATADPRLVRVTRLDWPLTTGRVQATGTLGLESPFMAEVEAQLEDAMLGEVLERTGVDDLTVHLVASGSARMKGALVNVRGPVFTGAVDLDVRDFGVFDTTWRNRTHAENRWAGLAAGRMRGGFELRTDGIGLRDVRIDGGRSEIHADGEVWFGAAKGMELTVRAPALDLADLGPYGPTPIKGFGSLDGTIEGPYRALFFDTRARFAGVDCMGYELGDLSAEATMNLAGQGTLDVPVVRGVKGHTEMQGRMFMSFGEGAPMEAELELPVARFEDIATVARGVWPWLDAVKGRLSAEAIGSVTARGPAAKLDIDARIALGETIAWGQRFERGLLEAGFTDGNILELRNLVLERGAGEVLGSGEFDLASQKWKGSLKTRQLRVGDIDALAAALPGVDGGVQFTARARGSMQTPDVTARITLRDWWNGQQPLGTVRLNAALDGNQARVEGSIATPWGRDETPPARADGAAYPMPPDSMFHEFFGDVLLEGEMPWSATVELDVPDVSKLLPAGAFEGMRASGRGTATAKGFLTKPAATTAELSLDELRFEKGRARFSNAGPVLVGYTDGRLTLHQAPLRGPRMTLDAVGTREADGTLALQVDGNAELGILEELVPGLAHASGDVALALQVRGTDLEPIVLGEAKLANIEMTPAGGLVALTDGEGSIVFSPDAVGVSGLSALVNGAPVEAQGRVTLEQFAPKDVDLALRLEEVPLTVGDVPMRLSGAPTLRGSPTALRLGGELALTWLRFTTDLELERTILQAIDLSRRPAAPKVFEKQGEFLTLDLGLRLGDVRVENNLVRAGIGGELRLVGTNRRPGLLGALTLSDATARLRNVDYRVTSGVLQFNDPNRIRPAFDVRADAQVRDYLVHITAMGTPQTPRLLLSSEPALPHADILTLMTLGVTGRDLERTGSESGVGLLLDAAYNANVLGLSEQVKRILPQLLPENPLLRDTQLRVSSAYSELSGNIEPVAQFQSKVWGEKVRVRGQTSLVGRGSRALLEYRVDENLSVQGQADSNNPGTASGFDVGGDVKWQVEVP